MEKLSKLEYIENVVADDEVSDEMLLQIADSYETQYIKQFEEPVEEEVLSPVEVQREAGLDIPLSPQEAQAKRLEEINVEKGRETETLTQTLLGEEGTLEGFKSTMGQFGARAMESLGETGADILDATQDTYMAFKDEINKRFFDEEKEIDPVLTEAILTSDSPDEMYNKPVVEQHLLTQMKEKEEKERDLRNTAISRVIESARNAETDTWGIDETAKRSWDELGDKQHGILDKAVILAEMAVGDVSDSTGSLANILINSPSFVFQYSNKKAKEIADNLGQDKITPEIRAISVANAIVQAYSERIPMTGSLKADSFKKLSKMMALDAGLEVPAELLDASVSKYGTNENLTADEAKEIAVRSALAGGLTSGTLGVAPATVGEIKAPLQKRADARAKAKADAEMKAADEANEAFLTGQVEQAGADFEKLLDNESHVVERNYSPTVDEQPGYPRSKAQIDADAKEQAQQEIIAKERLKYMDKQMDMDMPDINIGAQGKSAPKVKPKTKTKQEPLVVDNTGLPTKDETKKAKVEPILTEAGKAVVEETKPEPEPVVEKTPEQKKASDKVKNGYLGNPRNITKNTYNKAELVELADAFGMDVKPSNPKKKNPTAKDYMDALNANEEIVEARKTTPVEKKTVESEDKAEVVKSEYIPDAEEQARVKAKLEEEATKKAELEAEAKIEAKAEVERKKVEAENQARIEALEAKAAEDAKKRDEAERLIREKEAEERVKAIEEAQAKEEEVVSDYDDSLEVEDYKALEHHKPFLYWDADDKEVYRVRDRGDPGREPVNLRTREDRAKFFDSRNVADPEAITPEMREDVPEVKAFRKAKARYNAEKDRFEQLEGKGSLADEERMAKAKKVYEDAMQDVAGVDPTAMTRAERASVKQVTTNTAPEGTAVEGQAEVEAGVLTGEDIVDDIGVDTKMSDEEIKRAAQTVADFRKKEKTEPEDTAEKAPEEPVQATTQEDPMATPLELGPTVEALTEAVNTWSPYKKSKRRGYVGDKGRFSAFSQEGAWFFNATDAELMSVDARTEELVKEGLKGGIAFEMAVGEAMDTAQESAFQWPTPEEVRSRVEKAATPQKPVEMIQTERQARRELEAAFGEGLDNIIFKKGRYHPTRNVQAIYNKVNGKPIITVWYESVPKGSMGELILHEKGVHEILARDPALQDAYQAVVERMRQLIAEGNTDVIAARKQAIKALESKYNRQLDFTDPADIAETQEETVAYIMNFSKDRGWLQEFIDKVKTTMKDWFNVDLQPDDLRILVTGLVKEQALKGKKKAAEMKREALAEQEAQRQADLIEAELAAEWDAGLESVAPDSVRGQVASDSITANEVMNRRSDKLGKIGDLMDWIGNKTLMMPTDPYLQEDTQRRFGFTGIMTQLRKLAHEQERESNVRMEKENTELVEPAIKLAGRGGSIYASDTGKRRQREVMDVVHNTQWEQVHPTEASGYRKLDDEQRAVLLRFYEQSQDGNNKYIAMLEEQLLGPEVQGATRAEMQQLISQFKANKHWMPLQRHGKYRIEAEFASGEGKYVSRSETIADAEKEMEAIRRDPAFKDGATLRVIDDYTDDAKMVLGQNRLSAIDKALESNNSMNAEGIANLQSAIYRIAAQLHQPSQFKKRMSKRTFVAGASKDLVANTIQASRNYDQLLNMHYVNKRADVWNKIDEESEELRGKMSIRDIDNMDNRLNELKRREADIFKAGPARWSREASKISYLLHLAFNYSTAMINLTQPHILGIPRLATDYGYKKAAAEIAKAQTQFGFGMANLHKRIGRYQNSKLSREEQKLFDAEANPDVKLALDNTEMAMMTNLTESTTGFEYAEKNVIGAMGKLQQATEVANRQAMILATFRLARSEKGLSFDEAKKEALAMNEKVNMDFGQSGKSRFQRGDIGNVIFNFKSHPWKMMEVQMRMAKKAFGKWKPMPGQSDAEFQHEKETAVKEFKGMMFMNFLYGGMVGVPMYGLLGALFQVFGDEDEDLEEFVYNRLDDIGLPDYLKESVTRGFIPATLRVDTSTRTSLGQSLFRFPQDATSYQDWLRAVTATGGPILARMGRVPDAAQMMDEGKHLDAALHLGLPTFLTNPKKAMEWYGEGVASDRFGQAYSDDFDWVDALQQAVGFSPYHTAEDRQDFYKGKRTMNRYKRQATRLRGDWVAARMSNDYAEMRKIEKDAQAYNDSIKRYNRTMRKSGEKELGALTKTSFNDALERWEEKRNVK